MAGKEEIRNLEVQLTEKERIEAGKFLAEQLEAIEIQELALTETKRRFKANIDTHRLEVARLTGVVNHGVERREIRCEWKHLWEEGCKTLTRIDTGELVDEREITEEERQRHLMLQEKEGEGPDNVR